MSCVKNIDIAKTFEEQRLMWLEKIDCVIDHIVKVKQHMECYIY